MLFGPQISDIGKTIFTLEDYDPAFLCKEKLKKQVKMFSSVPNFCTSAGRVECWRSCTLKQSKNEAALVQREMTYFKQNSPPLEQILPSTHC